MCNSGPFAFVSSCWWYLPSQVSITRVTFSSFKGKLHPIQLYSKYSLCGRMPSDFALYSSSADANWWYVRNLRSVSGTSQWLWSRYICLFAWLCRKRWLTDLSVTVAPNELFNLNGILSFTDPEKKTRLCPLVPVITISADCVLTLLYFLTDRILIFIDAVYVSGAHYARR